MNRYYVVQHRTLMAFLCGIALMAAATVAAATSVSFGARKLDIPSPGKDMPVATAYPGMISVVSAYLPPNNRLVEMYVMPDQFKEIGNAGHPQLDHYFQLQVPRTMEGIRISAAQFLQGRANIKAGLEKESGKIQSDVNTMAHNGNQHLHALTGSDSSVSAGNFGKMGVYRELPWGVFFSMQSTVTVSGHAPTPLVTSGAIILVNGQVLYVYAISDGSAKADIQWTQQSLDAWADAIHAANPG